MQQKCRLPIMKRRRRSESDGGDRTDHNEDKKSETSTSSKQGVESRWHIYKRCMRSALQVISYKTQSTVLHESQIITGVYLESIAIPLHHIQCYQRHQCATFAPR